MKKIVVIALVFLLAIISAVIVYGYSLHMSNEVLESFGTINEKFEEANTISKSEASVINEQISNHNSEDLKIQADKIEKSSTILFDFIEDRKDQMLARVNMKKDSIDFSTMDKPSKLFFENDRAIGNEFILQIETYRKNMIEHTKGFSDEELTIDIQKAFNTSNKNGTDWLEYEFDDFPLIASYTKLTALQNDIKEIKLLALNLLLEK